MYSLSIIFEKRSHIKLTIEYFELQQLMFEQIKFYGFLLNEKRNFGAEHFHIR